MVAMSEVATLCADEPLVVVKFTPPRVHSGVELELLPFCEASALGQAYGPARSVGQAPLPLVEPELPVQPLGSGTVRPSIGSDTVLPLPPVTVGCGEAELVLPPPRPPFPFPSPPLPPLPPPRPPLPVGPVLGWLPLAFVGLLELLLCSAKYAPTPPPTSTMTTAAAIRPRNAEPRLPPPGAPESPLPRGRTMALHAAPSHHRSTGSPSGPVSPVGYQPDGAEGCVGSGIDMSGGYLCVTW